MVTEDERGHEKAYDYAKANGAQQRYTALLSGILLPLFALQGFITGLRGNGDGMGWDGMGAGLLERCYWLASLTWHGCASSRTDERGFIDGMSLAQRMEISGV
jgi:hypothetical protein